MNEDLRASVAGFVAMTLAAVVAATLHWQPIAVMAIGLVSFGIGVLVWTAGIERRNPWPFGPPGPVSNRSWPAKLGFVFALILFTSRPWPFEVYLSPATGLGSPLPGFEGRVNVLQLPANAAATLIAGIGLWIALPLIVALASAAIHAVPLGRRRAGTPGPQVG